MRNPRILAAGLGGVVATLVDVAVLATCIERGMAVGPAAFLGASSGAGANFLINKYWAFRDPRPLSVKQVATYGLVSVATALLMAFAMTIVVTGLGVPYLAAKAVCAVGIFVAWSYPAQRRFVFPSSALVPAFGDPLRDPLGGDDELDDTDEPAPATFDELAA